MLSSAMMAHGVLWPRTRPYGRDGYRCRERRRSRFGRYHQRIRGREGRLYIELDPEELEAVAIESKRTIDIDEFVPKDEIDELYLNNPYYIAPDGSSGKPTLNHPQDRAGRGG
jgi:hypothetical protein